MKSKGGKGDARDLLIQSLVESLGKKVEAIGKGQIIHQRKTGYRQKEQREGAGKRVTVDS